MKRVLVSLSVLFFTCLLSRAETRATPLTLDPTDRILILAPHPDDEILGTAGIIQRAVAMKIPIHIAFLTYGDNNAWSFTVYRKHPVFTPVSMRMMGEVRRREAVAASRILGLPKENLMFLGYPDHGTQEIFLSHWGEARPLRSRMTKVSKVPYTSAYRPDALYKGEEVLGDIESILRETKPTKIFTTNPADENPDHRAAYLFLRVALWDLEKEMSPQLFPFLVHYQFRRWPQPQGYHPNNALVLPALFSQTMMATDFELTPKEIDTKNEALHQHRTQFKYSGRYLSSFVRTNEVFCDFPVTTLKKGEPASLEKQELIATQELPEDMTSEEKYALLHFEHREASLQNGELVLTVSFRNYLKEKTKLSIALFGYRDDKPFGQMPKLTIEIRRLTHKYMLGNKKIPSNAIQLVRERRKITIKVPLELLGNPQKVLTGVRTFLEDFPLDCMAWRVLIP